MKRGWLDRVLADLREKGLSGGGSARLNGMEVNIIAHRPNLKEGQSGRERR